MLWDNRVQKRTPVQRSPLSASAHTHPVYCTRVVGTENAHNLISVSTDGKSGFFLDIRSKTQVEKTKTQAQKTFMLKTQNSGKFFRNFRRFLTKYYKFCLKSGKIVQKLKNLPKTQGKISKNLKIPANPLPFICRKIGQKKHGLIMKLENPTACS